MKRVTQAFPIVISGPSGAGKTTLVAELTDRDPLLRESVSVTTREPRGGEKHGEAYFFLSRAEFDKLKKGKLIEWAEVHGHLYGTPKEFVDKQLAAGYDVVLNVDVQGGAAVKSCFSNAVLVFILPPSFRELEERMRRRGTDEDAVIAQRLQNAREEIKVAKDYDYIVENDELDECIATVLAIITSERRRRQRYPNDFIDGFANS